MPGAGSPRGPLGEDPPVQVGVDDLAQGVHTGVGAAGTGQRHLVTGHRRQRRGEQASDRALALLGGKAVERRPVVGDKEHYATKRPARGRFVTGLEQPHTSSTRAIGALSPWRGPSLRMRM